MANHLSLGFIYLILVIAMDMEFGETTCLEGTSSVNNVEIQPIFRTLNEGEDAAFTCSFSILNVYSYSVTWEVSPDIYLKEVSSENTNENQAVVSTLAIRGVGTSSQTVRCRVDFTTSTFHTQCFLSDEARTNVFYFPKESQLSCGPQNNDPLKEGYIFGAHCTVRRSYPPVDVSWMLDDKVNISLRLPAQSEKGLMRVSKQELTITRELHMKKITCIITSSLAFPGRRLECSIGPFKVLYPPTVDLKPGHVNISVSPSTEFHCMANGFPEIFNYSWACFPTNIVSGCTSYNGFTEIILRKDYKAPTNETQYVTIQCTVSNSYGSASGTSLVTITQSAPENHDRYPLSAGEYDTTSRTLKGFWQVNLSCYVVFSTAENNEIFVQWFVEDQPFAEYNASCFAYGDGYCGSTLAMNSPIDDQKKSVTCMVHLQHAVQTIRITLNFENITTFSLSKPYQNLSCVVGLNVSISLVSNSNISATDIPLDVGQVPQTNGESNHNSTTVDRKTDQFTQLDNGLVKSTEINEFDRGEGTEQLSQESTGMFQVGLIVALIAISIVLIIIIALFISSRRRLIKIKRDRNEQGSHDKQDPRPLQGAEKEDDCVGAAQSEPLYEVPTFSEIGTVETHETMLHVYYSTAGNDDLPDGSQTSVCSSASSSLIYSEPDSFPLNNGRRVSEFSDLGENSEVLYGNRRVISMHSLHYCSQNVRDKASRHDSRKKSIDLPLPKIPSSKPNMLEMKFI